MTEKTAVMRELKRNPSAARSSDVRVGWNSSNLKATKQSPPTRAEKKMKSL
jgi:hypothetical protein